MQGIIYVVKEYVHDHSYIILKRTRFNMRKMSTCSLAVVCFFACSFPAIVYYLHIVSLSHESDKTFMLYGLRQRAVQTQHLTVSFCYGEIQCSDEQE